MGGTKLQQPSRRARVRPSPRRWSEADGHEGRDAAEDEPARDAEGAGRWWWTASRGAPARRPGGEEAWQAPAGDGTSPTLHRRRRAGRRAPGAESPSPRVPFRAMEATPSPARPRALCVGGGVAALQVGHPRARAHAWGLGRTVLTPAARLFVTGVTAGHHRPPREPSSGTVVPRRAPSAVELTPPRRPRGGRAPPPTSLARMARASH